MALFGLGKKKEEKNSNATQLTQHMASMPNLPEFPSLEEDDVTEFPKYEPSVADIKKEVSKSSDEDLSIPMRNQDFTGKKMAAVVMPEASKQSNVPSKVIGEEKSLFVKIDNYKQALHTLEALKAKIEDAEEVIRAFEDIKIQEDEKLESWKKDLQNMKDKLLSIDKELFEV